ncbi:hypothetical protein T260_05350 [Geobacillus thermopakistaniensis]|uniref:Uncharacterized protein n=1 Tax=Geobacillus thermopakistaniensis (strain MAS1) TaxID=1408282 RepID=A0A7U9JCH8_GEOTM|nr:hypothetical protein T260_05350 [Geobacillus sp. MAS1]
MILEWREEQHLYIRLLRLRSDMIEPHFLLNHQHSRFFMIRIVYIT